MDGLAAALEWDSREATAQGLAYAMSHAIRDGALVAGTKLPPIRTVAAELRLSPTTVSAGWSILVRSGAITTDGRRGTTVTDIRPGSIRYRKAMERQSFFELDLSSGVPDPKLLPDLSRALRNLTTAGTPGSYLDDPVLPELIDQLRADWPYQAQEFAIVDGAMDALDALTRSLRFGDRVIVEHPTFPLLLDLIDATGAEAVGVPLDDQGIHPDALRAALATPSSMVIMQPRAHNPTGVSLGASRAREIAGILKPVGVTVIEDDSAGSVATAASISLGRWIPNQVLHVRSFSKSHGPDLRLAAVSGPKELIEPIVARRQLGQGWSSRLLQRILFGLLTESRSTDQVAYAREEYRRRRETLIGSLADKGVRVKGSDGINVWVPVMDESAAVVRLASQGIGVAPGAPFSALPDRQGHIRVTVGAVAEGHAELAEQIARAAQTGSWSSAR